MKRENKKNWEQFLREGCLYEIEPLVNAVDTWMRFEDVPDVSKARIFLFQVIDKEKLYVAFCKKDGKNYAKLYIVDGKNISILYMRSCAVNPVRKFFHVTRKIE